MANSDVVGFAWLVLRERVMDRACHSEDVHPERAHAAFNTIALHHLTDDDARFAQVTESLALFRAISRLPALQVDGTVFAHCLGHDDTDAADWWLHPSRIDQETGESESRVACPGLR
ncbi:hypothetical protein ACWD3I_45930 [Streptomyces sp. NPDC002817]|uniref:hypothetical protein n=1 Tax=Streptomyces sp. NPDC088357 TaxID=3154655 RepID=UPI003431FFEE